MIKYFAAAILAALVCVVAIVAPAQAQNQRFQIASGDLGQALDAYVHQSARQLVYRVDDVRGVHSPGVQRCCREPASRAEVIPPVRLPSSATTTLH
jgi:hypothetical protein